MTAIHYSRGLVKFDNKPKQRAVPDFEAFVAALDRDRAKQKGQQYFCGPFNGDGKRSADGALPRRFLCVDFDRIAAEVLPELRMWFAKFSGCAWPTHSSTADAPRERVVIELSREVSREEALRIGEVLANDLDERFGSQIEVDRTTFRGEQPNYTPPVGVTLARFTDDPLDVDLYLPNAPELPAAGPSKAAKVAEAFADDPVLAHLNARGLVREVTPAGKVWIHCAFENSHTAEAEPFGTTYFVAHTNGFRAGHFRCLHAHCAERNDADFLRAIDYAPVIKPRDAPKGYGKEAAPMARGESALELLARNMPRMAYLSKPWLPEGLTLLAGRPKLGKTTLMRQMAAAVGQGSELFGEACEQSNSVFLQLEEGDRLNREKIERAGLPTAAMRAIFFFYEWPRGEQGAHQLDAYLTQYPDVRAVFIDSLTKFRSVPDRNLPAFMADYDAVSQLHAVAKRHPGRAFVLAHHTRKCKSDDPIDDISGTYGLTAACDTYWVMRKHNDGAELHVGGRMWDRDESAYGLIRGDQRWTLTAAFDGLTGTQENTLRIVREGGSIKPSALAKLLNISTPSAHERLKTLVGVGRLRYVRGGHGEYECT